MCQNKWRRELFKNTYVPGNAKRSAQNSAIQAERRAIVLAHYGNECECCGETTPEFLQIDHIEPIGHQVRKATGQHNITRWLIVRNFPPGYRLLCANCNVGRHRNGGICPHQKEGSQARAQARSRKCGEVPEALVQGQDMVESASKVAAVATGSWADNPYWPFDIQ